MDKTREDGLTCKHVIITKEIICSMWFCVNFSSSLTNQRRCVSSCVPGTYQSVLGVEESFGELLAGSDVCRPCHELCAECEGEGVSRAVCPRCKYATSLTMNQCVRNCHPLTGTKYVIVGHFVILSSWLSYMYMYIHKFLPIALTCRVLCK